MKFSPLGLTWEVCRACLLHSDLARSRAYQSTLLPREGKAFAILSGASLEGLLALQSLHICSAWGTFFVNQGYSNRSLLIHLQCFPFVCTLSIKWLFLKHVKLLGFIHVWSMYYVCITLLLLRRNAVKNLFLLHWMLSFAPRKKLNNCA